MDGTDVWTSDVATTGASAAQRMYLLDRAASYKLNYGLLRNHRAFFEAPRDAAVAANLSWWKQFMENRSIEMWADLSDDSKGPATFDPNLIDGIWIRNESFQFSNDDVAVATSPALTKYPLNGNFSQTHAGSSDVLNWHMWGPTPSACHQVPTPNASELGEGKLPASSAFCNVTAAVPVNTSCPTSPCPASFRTVAGLASDPFPIAAGGIYMWTLSFRAVPGQNGTGSCDESDGGTRIRIKVIPLSPASWSNDGVAGTSPGSACAGGWMTYSGTMLADHTQDGVAQIAVVMPAISMGKAHGPLSGYLGQFWVTGVRVIKMNGALLNVIRTDITDIEVTHPSSGLHYKRGVDFTIEQPTVPNNPGDGGALLQMFERKQRYRVHRLSSSAISPRQRVNISYDFIPGYVGTIDDGSQCNSFAEPRFYELMELTINFTMDTFGPKYVFINHDEMHGFNRDSRARRLGLSNAALLARDINWHQRAVARKDPEARVVVYADMLNWWHNGNTTDYQVKSGGIPGATWTATELLDKRIIQVPWYYPWTKRNNSLNATAWPTLLPSPLPAFYEQYGIDWVGSIGMHNISSWSQSAWNGLVAASQKRGLGILSVHWSDGPFDLYNTSIPIFADMLWNIKRSTRSVGCGNGGTNMTIE